MNGKQQVKYKAGFETSSEGSKEVITVYVQDTFFNTFELKIRGLALPKAIELVDFLNRGKILATNLLNQDKLPVSIKTNWG